MSKKFKKHKKGLTMSVHSLVENQSVAVPETQDDFMKRATISDLKKTTIIIALLFAVEFLIFYANLMGVGA